VAHRFTPTRRALAVAALLLLAVAGTVPAVSGAAPGAPADTREQREQVRRQRAEAAARLDVLRATDAEVEAALDALDAHVAGQEAALDDARRAVAAAEAALEAARAREKATLAEIAETEDTLRQVAVDAYISAGNLDEATAVLRTEDIEVAVQRQSYLGFRAGQYREVLDRLHALSEDLALARADAEAAATAAAEHRSEVERRLAEVRAARDQQAALAAEVDARIERTLSEAAALAELDAALSQKLAAEAAARSARTAGVGSGGSGGPARIVDNSGEMVTVRGPGGAITVHRSIADQLAAMLDAAAADGIILGGGGYRSPDSQIRLRRAHCPDVWNSPPSSCSPPTARPGHSNHERGLAVDFTVNGRTIGSRSSAAFRWLAANAGRYGFQNLPSEPWHWSVDGN
jgi:hypothetical protein